MSDKQLTPKQGRFIEEYLIDLNATQAAIRAGYSKKTARSIACELLTKPDIQLALSERRQLLVAETGITPESVLVELARIGLSDMRKFATWGARGVTLNDVASLNEDDARCVAEVSETRSKDGGSIKFKLHDKVGALTQIGRHFGMFADKLELSVVAGLADRIKLARERASPELRALDPPHSAVAVTASPASPSKATQATQACHAARGGSEEPEPKNSVETNGPVEPELADRLRLARGRARQIDGFAEAELRAGLRERSRPRVFDEG